jgi:hypothetical protein
VTACGVTIDSAAREKLVVVALRMLRIVDFLLIFSNSTGHDFQKSLSFFNFKVVSEKINSDY